MNKSREFAVVILAAGKGSRLKSKLHKVLHNIAGRPIIEHLMAQVQILEPAKTIVIVGDEREQVIDQVSDRAICVVQEPQLGTGHAVAQAKDELAGFEGDVIMLLGDAPFITAKTIIGMLERLRAHDEPAVVVLGFEPEDALQYGRVITHSDMTIEKMVEFKDANEAERATRLCNSGLMAARSKDLFDLLERVDNDNAQGEYYLPDIVNVAVREGHTCAAVVADKPEEVLGINSRKELAAAEHQWQELRREEALENGVTLKAPDTVFFSYDTELATDVTIEPNVVFGPGVKVERGARIRAFSHLEGAHVGEDCEVGPYARLRPGAVMEKASKVGNFVEMKKATLGEGAKANHLSYLGDAFVGAGANIGAGTITCNYDGYFKHQTRIGERAFIGSNSSLIAPVSIGADAIVAAGSAVSRDVAAGELRMVRAEQLVKPGWADRFHDAMKKKKAAEKKG
ncbi:bifunctional UDP-N-acetylglucosamine diphosphorylase/glucosamine-1-phosphate N-acetyltransferase GlmU [Qipengyuania huizhouensis]|uniref:bifunctional UDP-N-acetylglucosamine diphosphorylase/glucosamine-1-phosphate N-acetyltransferase GlmU n=1 Tax=Qipengyuania huizhouensis TaxID=2867245 RepID=UPI001C8732A0|nr:bifunctional UDP-N-acetylglucosamine diphosphorylase/glucosamine-1-phosphate N-acetyltransferase GlmU [Qipengyuania huizhouensis]MBX7460657.1 bifunctional UDP-N-acetylglucosamine diphosphorylase/glucosamine-1-phosphate N-acetyltransferase GlmU [Qipengyuania huizhouensis]